MGKVAINRSDTDLSGRSDVVSAHIGIPVLLNEGEKGPVDQLDFFVLVAGYFLRCRVGHNLVIPRADGGDKLADLFNEQCSLTLKVRSCCISQVAE